MNKKIDLSQKIFNVLGLCFCFILVGGLLFRPLIWEYLVLKGYTKGYFLAILWSYYLIGIIYLIFYFKIIYCSDNLKIILLIFILSVIPRVAFSLLNNYVPTNDFQEYFRYGQNVLYGKFSDVASIIENKYQLPTMGGIALFNGLIARIFSPTVLGFQLANAIMTSLICVVIYLILVHYNKKLAIISALLYALYPSSIVSTQITTNHHGATLFLFIAVLLYDRYLKAILTNIGPKKLILLGARVGCVLAISNAIHPSAIIPLIAMIIIILIVIVNSSTKKHFKNYLIYMVSIITTYSILGVLCLQCYLNIGIINTTNKQPVLIKLVYGLNQQYNGNYNREDNMYIKELPYEEQSEACIKLIKQRLEDPIKVVELIKDKTITAWFERDSYFSWYKEGKLEYYKKQIQDSKSNEEFEKKKEKLELFISGMEHLDVVFVQFLYIMSIIGVFFIIKRNTEFDILFLTLLLIAGGWIIFIAISELQSRYRYPVMPIFAIFAAMGLNDTVIYIRSKVKWKK